VQPAVRVRRDPQRTVGPQSLRADASTRSLGQPRTATVTTRGHTPRTGSTASNRPNVRARTHARNKHRESAPDLLRSAAFSRT
jgi:hypothetical protein